MELSSVTERMWMQGENGKLGEGTEVKSENG